MALQTVVESSRIVLRPPRPQCHLRLGQRQKAGLIQALVAHSNGMATYEFARSSAGGTLATLYGSRAPFVVKLVQWLRVLADNFLPTTALPWILLVGIVGVLAAFVICARRSVQSDDRRRRVSLAVVAGLQIALLLVVFSLMINEENRVTLAIGPSLVIVLVWATRHVRSVAVLAGILVALSAQWAMVNARQLGRFGWRDESYWAQPPVRHDGRAHDLERVVNLTCSPSTTGRYIMTAVNLDWINFYTLQFYSAKASLNDGSRCYFWYLGLAETDADAAWKRLLDMNVPYVVTLDDSAMPSDQLNQVSGAILQRIRTDSRFVREPFQADSSGILVFRQVAGAPAR